MKQFIGLILSCLTISSFLTAVELPRMFTERVKELKAPVTERVLVVSTSEQVLRVFENGTLTHTYPVSTAEAGNGQLSNSYQTPLGLHKVSKKIGSGAEPKTIFRARQNTGKKWTPANTSKEDLVLTRILWLEGLEPGFNKGRNARGDLVDSMKRYIYIHGTNDEKAIGRPASKGCVRMETNNLMEVYQETPTGTLVWIEE